MLNTEITTIIWDLDGTITDTLELHFTSFKQALTDYDFELTREKFLESFGKNNTEGLQAYYGRELDPEFIKEVSDKKEEIYRRLCKEFVKPIPGVVEWIDYFNKQGLKQAIGSSAPKENIDVALDATNLRHYFKIAMAGADLPSKPAPDLFLKVAESLGSQPEECVVIEDAVAGVRAGNSAGMVTAGIVGTCSGEELPADLILDDYLGSPAEFLEQVNRLMRIKFAKG